jgi:hypothetical protein
MHQRGDHSSLKSYIAPHIPYIDNPKKQKEPPQDHMYFV